MSSRNLPGFLRRSLRIDYGDDDDDEEDDDEGIGEGASDSDASDQQQQQQQQQQQPERGNDRSKTGRPGSNESVSTTTTNNNTNTPGASVTPSSIPSLQSNTDPEQGDSIGALETIQERQPTTLSSSSYHLPSSSSHRQSSSSESNKGGGKYNHQQMMRSKLSDSWQETPAASLPPAEGTTTKLTYRETQFEKYLVHADVVSMSELRKLGWNGIPAKYRALAWKILLGYMPTNVERRQQTLRRKRSEYKDAMAQHYDIDDDVRTLQEQETLRQVLVDVPRTAPDIPLFRNDRIKRILTRLLYIWAMRHPASSYVQGINDLATPLVTVFLADYYDGQDVLDGHVMNHLSDHRLEELEADVYWCLTNLLAGIQDHYTSDQPGVQRMVMRLEELVNRIDASLAQHLREEGVQFLQFAFKWMNCLLLREFHLRVVPRLWDTYISERNGFEDFHVYVCAAFLCQFSGQLQDMGFDELFTFFQEMPTSNWTDMEVEMLLSQAYVLSTLFAGSDAHLASNNASTSLY